MTVREHIEGIWANRTWLKIDPRPVLVDYSGLKIRTAPWKIMAGNGGYRPIVLLMAAFIFLSILVLPVPGSLIDLVEQVNPSGYAMMETDTETIVDSVNYRRNAKAFQARQESAESAGTDGDMDSRKDVARRAMIMLAILNQSQGGNYILERWQRHGRCKHQCVGSGL